MVLNLSFSGYSFFFICNQTGKGSVSGTVRNGTGSGIKGYTKTNEYKRKYNRNGPEAEPAYTGMAQTFQSTMHLHCTVAHFHQHEHTSVQRQHTTSTPAAAARCTATKHQNTKRQPQHKQSSPLGEVLRENNLHDISRKI
jgi:hypothetical protein